MYMYEGIVATEKKNQTIRLKSLTPVKRLLTTKKFGENKKRNEMI